MEHDRDEWKRPWRVEETPEASAPSRRAGVAFVNDEGGLHAAESTANGAPTDELVHDAPARPFPQPPPPSWDEHQEGPGSPAGSVRPPDTTGTVDAPPPEGSGAAGRLRSAMATGLVGALIGAVLGTAGTLAVLRATPAFDRVAGGSVQAPIVTTGSGSVNSVVPAVAQAVTPSVVRIDILTDEGEGLERVTRSVGLGSGVIYRSDGFIITNNHVVEDADGFRVRFSSGDAIDAELVGTDPLTDLAVLRVDRTGLPAINIREEAVVVGETAIAIGSPFGLDASVTAGVVSALNRDIQVPDGETALVIPAVIQTDAAINPGNSGGALVDANGQLIGINTAILTGSGGSQGVGFAIPSPQAIASADELIAVGFVRHPFLGISGVDVSPEVAARFGLETREGAVVDSVQPGSGAADAGLEANDIIVALDGEPIRSMSDLVVTLRDYDPGDTVTLDILRDGDELRVDVTLGERPR